MGLQLSTVIPVELSAADYPQRRKNQAGQWEVVLRDGKPQPRFTGKNPSKWASTGQPETIQHRTPPTAEQVLAAIDTAEQLGKPIGLAILPTSACSVADFDPKDYAGGVVELQADFERLLAEHPELKQTRIERTPSGGIHIYLRAADGLKNWRKAKRGMVGFFTTQPDGPKRGEMLAGTRVSVTAPTLHRSTSRQGAYRCIHSPYKVLEVPSLEAVGLYPVKTTAKPERSTTTARQAPTSTGEISGVNLRDLLGRRARDVLSGGTPYGEDRSSNLTGFARELWGWCNYLEAEGLPYQGSAEQLVADAITQLQIEDKADRVLETITRSECDCCRGDTRRARNRYEQLLGRPAGGGSRSPRPATFDALIQSIPAGWISKVNRDGEEVTVPSKLSPGRLAQLLTDTSGQLRFNLMDLRAEVLTTSGWQRITDADMDSAYVLLSGMGWIIGIDPLIKAVLHVARQTPVHPVRDYLERVAADPAVTPFDLDQVAREFFRAADPLHAAMVRKWLVGAVARAFDPGSQMDYCLVLKGAQGQRKSRALEALASKEWHCSSIPEGDKDILLNVHSTWIYELAELESVTSRKESGRMKNLITTSVDNMRPPYGRTAERLPRQSVFAATVNEETFLRDDTGNRRFWVVPVEGTDQLDRDGLIEARDSIWKAAVIAHRSGELPMLTAEMEALSAVQNEEFNQQDPWVEMVRAWMDGDPLHRFDPDRDPSTLRYDPSRPFTSAEVLYSAGLRQPAQITRADEMRVSTVLRQMGFRRGNQRRVDGQVVRPWEPSQPSQPSQPQFFEVVTPQTHCAATDLPTLSQPSQPFSSEKKGDQQQAPPPARGPALRSASKFSGRKGCDGCDSSSEPLRRKGSACHNLASQPRKGCDVSAEVVTPPLGGLDLPETSVGSVFDVLADGDDPAWGPRPELVA